MKKIIQDKSLTIDNDLESTHTSLKGTAVHGFQRIMAEELKLTKNKWSKDLPNKGEYFYGIVKQIIESASAAFVLRIYNNYYNMTEDPISFESVGAHTNLAERILERSLYYQYGFNFKKTPNGYREREMKAAIARHDLPEIEIKDAADNGTRDDKRLAYFEKRYWKDYSAFSPLEEQASEARINDLLNGMSECDTPERRTLKLSDKTAAIVIALCCDYRPEVPTPLMSRFSEYISENDIFCMSSCDYCKDGEFYKASEMWTVDIFKSRKQLQYDDSGFFTALIVMTTLIVNRKWYKWRIKDYKTTS